MAGRPRQGSVFEYKKLTNARYKYAIRFICKNEQAMRADSMAKKLLTPVSSVKVNASSTDILESSSSSVSLSCSSSGSPLSFLLLNSSSEVTGSDRVQITDGNSTVTIVNVTRYDQEPFSCHASNPVSEVTSDPVTLLIVFGPENINLIISPSQEYYDEGSDIILTCSADSGPPAFVQWFLNGDLMSDTGSDLSLMNVHMSQSGNYSCQAFNNKTLMNQTSQTVAVSVRKSHISDVVITPSSTDLSEFSSSVSLSCSSSGSFLSFLWLNSSSEVTLSDRVQITDEGSTLNIINVTRYDQGPFICHVFNNFSNYTNTILCLFLAVGPEKTLLKLSPSQEYFEKVSNISLSCSADSKPSAVFKWFLNRDLLSDTGPDLSLMNVQINQSGSYSCQAFNEKTLRYETSQAVAISLAGFAPFNVTRYDQGPFRCNASNGATSEISRSMDLFIQYGPDNMAIKGPESVRVGDFTMLYCSTMSVPSPTFTWFLDGKPTCVHEAAYVIMSISSSDSGTYSTAAPLRALQQA
ncbi:carcinoembryonic antigen-related cell adhesion molecule 5-like [Gymnodraco acuticeps]|uniref:Carcinoembryonic antigen-related cell adhesion molecule 5-like n=1 Tax=Gymnodraco acuticeps TaxID=8218 RepID=A0A6P8UKC0_GYMAC|nr:carcinoembryonic antigen-related cell adhesion molecule 5-like [Gymnodraco acuticeps]